MSNSKKVEPWHLRIIIKTFSHLIIMLLTLLFPILISKDAINALRIIFIINFLRNIYRTSLSLGQFFCIPTRGATISRLYYLKTKRVVSFIGILFMIFYWQIYIVLLKLFER